MILLSIDTSSPQGSLALFEGGKLLGEKSWSKKSTHSELLTTSFTELLKESKKALEDISHIAVGTGPGSFTGIRVGINFARALAYARNLKVFSSDSIAVIAKSVSLTELSKSSKQNLLVQVSAFRNFVYYGLFKAGPTAWQYVEGPGVLTTDDLKSEKYKDSLVITDTYPIASQLGQLAFDSLELNKFKSWREVTPLYIRRSEAEEKFGVCL